MVEMEMLDEMEEAPVHHREILLSKVPFAARSSIRIDASNIFNRDLEPNTQRPSFSESYRTSKEGDELVAIWEEKKLF